MKNKASEAGSVINPLDLSGRPFHFIGIGGIGMSALAYVLAKRDLPVSGSDTRSTPITERLAGVGARVFGSQAPENLVTLQREQRQREPNSNGSNQNRPVLTGSTQERVTSDRLSDRPSDRPDNQPSDRLTAVPGVVPTVVPIAPGQPCNGLALPQVICSTAIRSENLEYQAAIDLGCPIFHRSDVLAALMNEYRGIAVAGTHGKTTTSSLIGYILLRAGIDPTIIVGGEVTAWEGNARSGHGEWLVAEADESDGSLVKLRAEIGVVTNIELDHPDHYASLDSVVTVFQAFRDQCQVLVGCWDCPTTRDRLKLDLTYSLDPTSGADYTVDGVTVRADGLSATVYERGDRLGLINLRLLGQHNLSNALAAIAVARHVGLDFAAIAAGLAGFEGARRRFEHRGTVQGIAVYDDYAHHPSEILVTLAAARQRLADGQYQRVVAAFQPHRYSRTQAFLGEFARAFGDADWVVIADVYGAGEVGDGALTGRSIAALVAQHHAQPDQVSGRSTPDDVRAYLATILRPGDLVLFLGAGNLNQAIPGLLADLGNAIG